MPPLLFLIDLTAGASKNDDATATTKSGESGSAEEKSLEKEDEKCAGGKCGSH